MLTTRESRALLALLAAAILYGATFVVIKSAVETFPPISFVGWRFALGAGVLFLLAVPRGKTIWAHGAIAGVALFAGYALQTAGLTFTSASNSALITGLYVVVTPFLAVFFNRTSPSWWTISAAITSFLGLILLTEMDGFTLQPGDLLTLGCAVAFAAHIVLLARFAKHHPVLPFTAVQLLIPSLLAFPLAMVMEGPMLPPSSVWVALLITGIGISAGGFLLQIWGQTVIAAGTAAVILATEAAFGVATGWLVLGERFTSSQWIGAVLIMGAIYVVITKQRDRSSAEAEAVTPAH